jgi:hypothetical protein
VLSDRRKALCILLWALELVNGGLTLAVGYTSYVSKNIFAFEARWSWLVSTALVLAVIVSAYIMSSPFALSLKRTQIDTANTVCLCWYMYKTSDGLEGYGRLGHEWIFSTDVYIFSRMKTVSKKVIVYTLGPYLLFVQILEQRAKR